jgi:hypothetical protein
LRIPGIRAAAGCSRRPSTASNQSLCLPKFHTWGSAYLVSFRAARAKSTLHIAGSIRFLEIAGPFRFFRAPGKLDNPVAASYKDALKKPNP